MSMCNEFEWKRNGISDVCFSNVREVSENAKEFQGGHSLILGQKENGTSKSIK